MTLAAQKKTSKAPTTLQVVKKQVVDRVTERITGYVQSGRLHIPPGYSPENALHAAWLILQDVKDRNDKPALEVCTHASIANSLFRMVVRALDPAKKQGYFIVYGQTLAFQESYFGNIMLAQRMAGVSDVLPLVVYEGDKFELAVERGRYVVEYHKPRMDADATTPIKYAYAIVEFTDGRPPRTEVMRWDQIQTSWKKSKTYKADGKTGMHHEQPDQAAIRTVINRALKPLINASTDAHLAAVLAEIERGDALAAAEDEIEVEAREYANQGETLELEPPTIDADEPDAQANGDEQAEGLDFGTGPGF